VTFGALKNLHRQSSAETIYDIKNHVLQVELLLLIVIFFEAFLSLEPALVNLIGSTALVFITFANPAIVSSFIRVTNPASPWISAVRTATQGLVALLAVSKNLFYPEWVPLGSALGAGIGAAGGAAPGPLWFDRASIRPSVMTQGEARKYLASRLGKYPSLTLETITEATKGD